MEDLARCTPSEKEAARTALQRLHRAGILHGDVQTSNFLFTEERGQMRVALVDFESALTASAVAPLGAEMRQELEELEMLLCGLS